MELYARHGDLVFERLESKPDSELKLVTDLVFAGDSSGRTHTLRGTCLARRDGRRTRIRLDAPAQIEHAGIDGHKTLTLEAGDYEVRPLREVGDRSVED
jgi:hypothetical protein